MTLSRIICRNSSADFGKNSKREHLTSIFAWENLNWRDIIAVRKMVDGYLKFLYPEDTFGKEQFEGA